MEEKQITKAITAIGSVMIVAVFVGLILQSILSNEVIADTTLTGTVTNETGAWINITAYTVDLSTAEDFAGLTLTAMYNSTDDTVIGVGNATVNGSGFTNATATNWDNVSVSYTYTYTGANPTSPVNLANISSTFAAFIVAITALFAVGGTIIGVLWLLPYIKPLLKKNNGVMGA